MHNDKDPKIDDRFSFQSILNTNDRALIYNIQIKHFLKIICFEHIWQNKGTFSKIKLIHAVKSKLLERYNIFFKEAVRGNIMVKGRTPDKLHSKLSEQLQNGKLYQHEIRQTDDF